MQPDIRSVAKTAGLTEKFTEAFLYVLAGMRERGKDVDPEAALHILFKADFICYLRYGESITGTQWQKGSAMFPDCPVPPGWDDFVLEYLHE